MNSRIVNRIELDARLLDREIEKILQLSNVKEEYSEYRFGTWKNYVLWNGSGDENDTLFKGAKGGAVQTGLGRQLEYITTVIEQNFHTDQLKMVRANLLSDAVLVPHRDYIEFKSDSQRLARLHLPIRTNLNSLHSESSEVFHMRKGEVWFLDVASIHSACNLSEDPRISLVLDFCLDGHPLESVFKGPASHISRSEPMMIEREPVDEEFLTSINALKHVVNRMNYRDVVLLLSRVHFYKNVSLSVFFDWLIGICADSADKFLLEKSLSFKEYMLHNRELAQRFSL